MKPSIVIVCVLYHVNQVIVFGAVFQNTYKVYKGHVVSFPFDTLTVSSVIKCAAQCNATATCITSTFDAVTKHCHLSNKTMMDTVHTGDPTKKTITPIQDIPVCFQPPMITNGELTLSSMTPVSSVGTLQCISGYVIGPVSPPSVICDITIGWSDVSTMECVPAPISPLGYYGTSFVTGFMKNGENNGGVPKLIIACQGTATVRVEIPHLAIDEVHVVTSSTTLTYSNTIAHITSGAFEQKAVFVSSDNLIMLYGINLSSGGPDGSLVVPIPVLKTEYFIAGHPSTLAGTDEFLIISLSNDNVVSLEYNSNPLAETITLNANQTYYKAAVDLSGTSITASSPIFVLSGHICANVPDNSVVYCDYIEEVMPPVTSLGISHVITYMKPRADFTISIVITVDSTSVTINDVNGTPLETLNGLLRKETIFRTYPGSVTISVESTAPVMVHQYGHGSNSVDGDPSMMFVPAVGFFGESYEFEIPSGFNSPSTLVIVISNTYSPAALKLNGQNFTPSQVISVTVPGAGPFTVVYADVLAGYNTLAYGSGVASFGAWVYGRTNIEEFAWTLGYAI